jgi:hypothetical protein
MSDKRRGNEKKEKKQDPEEMGPQYLDMPMPNMVQSGQLQHRCPMLYQCPVMQQCPRAGNPFMQMPYMPLMPIDAPPAAMKPGEWFEDWEDRSEDKGWEYDSEDGYSPQRYHMDYYKKNKQRPFYPPLDPYHKW